jgi:Terminase RNaseH-like domain
MTTLVVPKPYSDIERADSVYSELRRRPPRSRLDLKNYVKAFLSINVPDRKVCRDHSSPMDYLWRSYAADIRGEAVSALRPAGILPAEKKQGQDVLATNTRNADVVVWANRAGGKTELAAVATLLDCIFKPSCQVRILGGSGEQAGRMYDYLRSFLNRGFDEFLAGPMRKARCHFLNGSTVEVLTQSATSVRGQHVQKLRCDELELFGEDVFAAAKFTTQSTSGIIAGMELISTMHRPYGLMHKAVSAATQFDTPVLKWCVWEVIEKCRDRSCSQCPLWTDCRGKARNADGYLKIDDCITQMRRASRAGWEAEMLCKRPSRQNIVFDEFDAAVHVGPVDYDPNLPLYRALDFGFVNPFVCLWIQVDGTGVVRAIDEYVRSRATIDAHAMEIKSRTPAPEQRVTATFCDPAGGGVNDVTGTSAVRELRALGIMVRSRRSGILEGIELIRRAIRAGDGRSRLIISPRCPRLIEAMECYHYPDSARAPGELPLKDGLYDHPIDALRYFFINHARPEKTSTRRY